MAIGRTALSHAILIAAAACWSSAVLADLPPHAVNQCSALPDSVLADTTVYRTDQIDQQPIPIQIPDYRSLARQLGVSGKVMIRTLVGPEGQVRQTEVLQGAGALVDSIASGAMRKAVFKPAIRKNWPVSTWVVFPMEFVESDSMRIPTAPPQMTSVDGPWPEYPRTVSNGATGEVVVWAHVGEFGRVLDTVVETSTDVAFTDAALKAISEWQDVRPKGWVRIPFRFAPP